jgi:hypothetical protein
MKDGRMVLIAQPLLESRIGLYYIWSLNGPRGVYKVLHHWILIIQSAAYTAKTTKCAMLGEKPNTIYPLLASFSLMV